MVEFFKEMANSLSPAFAHEQIQSLILLCCIALMSMVAYYIAKGILLMFEKAIARSSTQWDDDLINLRLLKAISQLAPALIVTWMLPRFFDAGNGSVRWIDAVTSLYILWAIMRIIVIFIDNLYKAMLLRENLRAYAVKGIFQMFKLIIIGICVIIALSILIGKTPIAILTALGASAAVLSLVFKDTILGLVAGIQLTANKMLQRGDWIAMPNRDLNGEVLDVSLTTVKVRNWDNSVTTVPPYTLITDSFRNYRPMQESGGRRVERAIFIDMNTVRFLTESELDNLRADHFLETEPESTKPLTNIRAVRDHLEAYLRANPYVNQEMTLMVRQMPPTQSGLPLQLYFFTRSTEWVEHEHQQSDIFDYVYATVRRFGLGIFQTPAGTDIKANTF
ncbi:MAG: mechanosensitive ion channel family protein [Muribaculum sp.]|nr:mechanosensitive ion channel family protein [Muribaculaceae bacterium]MCM1081153.1 mechanosensitive ion channel family protein [Muribaculum sp.]